MKRLTLSFLGKLAALGVVSILLISPQMVRLEGRSAPAAATDTACRFGITSVHGAAGYDIASLGVGSYLDWGAVTNPTLPDGVEYIRVLRLRDDVYPATLANLPGWVAANPGGVWVVGNEPDTTYQQQDGILAEVYADRYYQLATIIRALDPTAKIGFGPIVQPTPIRIRYLERAWDRLVEDAGSQVAASNLIDIWTIHSFILNEQCGYWGTGVPPGFSCNDPDRVVISDFADTYSIDIFQERVIDFRGWMASIGERDKPLWITEYGSLLPPVDPIGGPDYVNVSDADTAAYMVQTFDFMLSATGEETGLPGDGNQLVQRWYWYSLNEHRYNYGGTLYNPDYPQYTEYGDDVVTPVGEAFMAYQTANLQVTDLLPVSLEVTPKSYNPERTRVDYRLEIGIDNNQFEDASCAQVEVYDGQPESGTLIAALPASFVRAEGGVGRATAYWRGVEPLAEHSLCVVVSPVGVEDLEPGNDKACYSVFLEEPKLTFLPLMGR
jgi:hypothetical protein